MQAKVSNLYFLGVDEGGLGDTNAYVATVGHTWSLSPTMLIDGNFGMNWQDQTAAGLGLRHQLRHRRRSAFRERTARTRVRAACRRSTSV